MEIEGPQFDRAGVGPRPTVERLTVSIVKAGNWLFPKWLEKLLDQQEWSRLAEVLDHRRHVGNIAYAEPYGASDTALLSLGEFCRKHGLRFSIIGKSNHYPSQTFRLVIWRPQDEEELKKLVHWGVWA